MNGNSLVSTRRLSDVMWPDMPSNVCVLVPVGSMEQHGPHLPLDTDAVVAEAVATRVADLLVSSADQVWEAAREVVVAPPICFGASGEHQAFPGTSSIGSEALSNSLLELARSMTTWASQVVFVNAHGGNVTAVKGAVARLQNEGRAVTWFPCRAPDPDAHAGRSETSLLLHICPDRVRLDRAEPGNTTPIGELLKHLVEDGVRPWSANGILGDPTDASAAEGAQLLEEMASWIYAKLVAARP